MRYVVLSVRVPVGCGTEGKVCVEERWGMELAEGFESV